MTESYKCEAPNCRKRIFVVPVFEVDIQEELPRNKRQLVNLLRHHKAVYFHQLTCVHCQKFPGLDQWKESEPGDIIKVSALCSLAHEKGLFFSFEAFAGNQTRNSISPMGTHLHWHQNRAQILGETFLGRVPRQNAPGTFKWNFQSPLGNFWKLL